MSQLINAFIYYYFCFYLHEDKKFWLSHCKSAISILCSFLVLSTFLNHVIVNSFCHFGFFVCSLWITFSIYKQFVHCEVVIFFWLFLVENQLKTKYTSDITVHCESIFSLCNFSFSLWIVFSLKNCLIAHCELPSMHTNAKKSYMINWILNGAHCDLDIITINNCGGPFLWSYLDYFKLKHVLINSIYLVFSKVCMWKISGWCNNMHFAGQKIFVFD